MSDPFRDDLEAAQARVDVLAREKAELEATVARLTAELAEVREKAEKWDAERAAEDKARARAKAKADKEREDARVADRSGFAERKKMIRSAILWGGGVVGLILAVTVPDCLRHRDHARWETAHAEHERAVKSWGALLAIGDCVHAAEVLLHQARGLDSETTDPRSAQPRSVRDGEGAGRGCVEPMQALAADPTVPEDVRTAIASWAHAAEAVTNAEQMLADYYDRGDWKDDAYASAPAKWATTNAARAALDKVVAAARLVVVPWRDREVVKRRDAQARGSSTWWRIEVGRKIDAIGERLATSVDARLLGAADPEAKAAAAALVDEVKAAPLEIRRDVRATDLEALANGDARVYRIDNTKFWGATTHDDLPFPPEDAEPSLEGCGGGGD